MVCVRSSAFSGKCFVGSQQKLWTEQWIENRNYRNSLFLNLIPNGQASRLRGAGDFRQGRGTPLLRGGRGGAEAVQSHSLESRQQDRGAVGRAAHQPHLAAARAHRRRTAARR